VGRSKGHRLKSLGQNAGDDVFFLSLEEAKRAILDNWEFLADRHERRVMRKNKLA
jgi:hypothetical protein